MNIPIIQKFLRSSGRLSGLRIALIYFLIGTGWIALTDYAVYHWIGDASLIRRVSAFKGTTFVLMTTIVLYVLLRRRTLTIEQTCVEADRAKHDFYRGTLYAVTEGRLDLCTRDEISWRMNKFGDEINIDSHEGLSALRSAVNELTNWAGMSECRSREFLDAVGEAAANAVKHAGGGKAKFGVSENKVQALIRDTGSGIDALTLPRTTLMRRFSTTKSMGLGYSIILGSCDSVCLSSDASGTWVLMEKLIAIPPPELSLENLPDTW